MSSGLLSLEDLQVLERISRLEPQIAQAYRQMVQDKLSDPKDVTDPWKVFTLSDAYEERPPAEYVVEGVLALPSLNIVYGAPGTLKSFWVADLITCVASGLDWLPQMNGIGGKKTRQTPVVWIDFDNGKLRTHERFAALARARGLPETTPLHYYSMPTPMLNSREKQDMDALFQRVVNLQARVVCVDNLGCVIGNVDENSSEMSKVMSNFRQLAESAMAAVIIIHHQRKSSGKPNAARIGDSLRGHSSIEAALDLALLVEREQQSETVLVKPTKVRGETIQPFGATFTYQQNEEGRIYSACFYKDEVPYMDPVAEWDQAMDLMLGEAPMNQKDLVAGVREKYPKAPVNKIRDRIKQRVVAGELEEGKGKSASERFYSLPTSSDPDYELQPLSVVSGNPEFLFEASDD